MAMEHFTTIWHNDKIWSIRSSFFGFRLYFFLFNLDNFALCILCGIKPIPSLWVRTQNTSDRTPAPRCSRSNLKMQVDMWASWVGNIEPFKEVRCLHYEKCKQRKLWNWISVRSKMESAFSALARGTRSKRPSCALLLFDTAHRKNDLSRLINRFHRKITFSCVYDVTSREIGWKGEGLNRKTKCWKPANTEVAHGVFDCIVFKTSCASYFLICPLDILLCLKNAGNELSRTNLIIVITRFTQISWVSAGRRVEKTFMTTWGLFSSFQRTQRTNS